MNPRDRLIVALDVSTAAEARALVDRLGDSVSFYKIGHELLLAGGLALAEALITEGRRVFLDMKLLDIANTVERAVANVARLGVDYLTVHGLDRKTLRAAVRGRGGTKLKLLSVTVLTSLDQADLAEQGIAETATTLVERRARLARDAGFDGVIASGQEAAGVRQATGPDFLIVTPGIRPAGAAAGDQARVSTPTVAIRAGASALVVGRPITAVPDPRAAALAIRDEIERALQ